MGLHSYLAHYMTVINWVMTLQHRLLFMPLVLRDAYKNKINESVFHIQMILLSVVFSGMKSPSSTRTATWTCIAKVKRPSTASSCML